MVYGCIWMVSIELCFFLNDHPSQNGNRQQNPAWAYGMTLDDHPRWVIPNFDHGRYMVNLRHLPKKLFRKLVVSTCFNPSEKYEFVSWDDYSQYVEKVKAVPNHQPDSLAGEFTFYIILLLIATD